MSGSGYFKDPTTGLIIQWGCNGVNSTGTTITLPVAFPTVCVSVVVTPQCGTSLTGLDYTAFRLSLSQFKMWTSSSNYYYLDWIAIGY